MYEINNPSGTGFIRVIAPDICSHCHSKCTPSILHHYNSKNESGDSAHYGIFKCPGHRCGKAFVVEYIISGLVISPSRFLNGTVNIPQWPDVILNLYTGFAQTPEEHLPSKFIGTYAQSVQAEQYGLNELAGMGFRKSIEYLVKDVAVIEKPEDREKIKKLFLGDVIKKYYTGEIKELLERATWLGNDQSHYFKLFEEYDVDTLKELIGLIVSELDTASRKKKYIENIQSKK